MFSKVCTHREDDTKNRPVSKQADFPPMSTSDYHPFNLCNKLYIHILEAINKFCAELQPRRYEVATFMTETQRQIFCPLPIT